MMMDQLKSRRCAIVVVATLALCGFSITSIYLSQTQFGIFGKTYPRHRRLGYFPLNFPLTCARVNHVSEYFPLLSKRSNISNIPKDFWDSAQWNNSHVIDNITFSGPLREDFCGSEVYVLHTTLTAPWDFENRQGVRDTWAGVRTYKGKNFEFVFITALSRNESINARVDREMRKHKDIIRLNYYDSKETMIFKTIMLFKFALERCPHAKYINHGSEDVLFTHHKILKILAKQPDRRLHFGCAVNNHHFRVVPRKSLIPAFQNIAWNLQCIHEISRDFARIRFIHCISSSSCSRYSSTSFG